MKRKNFLLLLILISLLSLGCQRDDICPETTDTTPLLIIRFYENQDPFEPQAPQNLSINEVGNEEYVFIRNDNNRDQIITYFRFTGDSLAIPLRTDNDLSSFEFTLNTLAEGEEPGSQEDLQNTDILKFTYGRQEEYINRACAYKINYVGLKATVEDGGDGSRWIQEVQVEEGIVDDQNQAHVSIFF
jgi:hypothetical protein